MKHQLSKKIQILRNHRVPSGATSDAILDYLQALNCPKSLAAALLYKYGEHQQLIDLKADPNDYLDPLDFKAAYAAVEFLSKADFLDLGIDRKAVALSKFFEFEERCKLTNSHFRNLSLCPEFTGHNVWLLHATIRKIETILGEFTAEEFLEEANWGPGVTTHLKGSRVSATNKFHEERGITRDLYSLVLPWFHRAYPLWASHLKRRKLLRKVTDHFWTSGMMPEENSLLPTAKADLYESIDLADAFKVEVGNHVVTVPKNAKTDRVIAIEPGLNLWFQKAIGSMLRKRLQRSAIDLNDQSRNQRLARLGSKFNHLATVDFSSASDSISLKVVEELLPPQWFQLLDICRSRFGIIDGEPHYWNKFSSMGNGFTFELESLIFFAAAKAVADYCKISSREISVYGDDVIIPSSIYDLFSKFCDFLGFKVNPRKSFSSGNFRESCGSHYYLGTDVKPIYLKGQMKRIPDVYRLANAIRRYSHGAYSKGMHFCDKAFYHPFHQLVSLVPKTYRFRIPEGFGDGGFVSNFDEATPTVARDKKLSLGWEGYFFSSLVETGQTSFASHTGLLLARLKVASVQEHGNHYALRGRTLYSVKPIWCQQWYDLGPWI